jgi:hypothetical protein
MSAFFQYAAVAYSRSNGSIIWHSFADVPAVPANISASQILQAYDTLLLDTTTLMRQNSSDLPLFSGSTFPVFLWMSEPVFSGTNAVNPAVSANIFSTLQGLLVMPIILCQNGFFQRLVPLAVSDKSLSNYSVGISALQGLLSPLPERTSPASFAYHRYEAIASTPTLAAYAVLNGLVLLACCVAQLVSAVMLRQARDRRSMPQLSRFPAFDLFAHCVIENEAHCVIYQGRSGAFFYDAAQTSELSWLSTLSMRWSRPPCEEDGQQLVGFYGLGNSGGGSRSIVEPPVTVARSDGVGLARSKFDRNPIYMAI